MTIVMWLLRNYPVLTNLLCTHVLYSSVTCTLHAA